MAGGRGEDKYADTSNSDQDTPVKLCLIQREC